MDRLRQGWFSVRHALAWSLCACMLTSCAPARFYLAAQSQRPGLGSEDRPCIIKHDPDDWSREHLLEPLCGAWTDRGMSELLLHEWTFFPHFMIGATHTAKRDCPDCYLNRRVLAGDASKSNQMIEVSIEMRVPPNKELMGRYEGQMRGGVFHGKGRLELHFNELCVRRCLDLFIANGEKARTISYSGMWNEGFLDETQPVSVSFELRDGTTYTGGAVISRRLGPVPTGEGRLVDGEGTERSGQWQKGLLHGEGNESRADGTTYEGRWRHGRFHGEGILKISDGAIYEGQFADGRRHGYGRAESASGFVREGQWDRDVFTGVRGRLQWADGHLYEGELARGVMEGAGVFRWPDGGYYEGYWHTNRMQGHGAYRWPDGSLYVGGWHSAQPEGCGLHVFAGGREFVGTWEMGVPTRELCAKAPKPLVTGDDAVMEGFEIVGRRLFDGYKRAEQKARERRAAQVQVAKQRRKQQSDEEPEPDERELLLAKVRSVYFIEPHRDALPSTREIKAQDEGQVADPSVEAKPNIPPLRPVRIGFAWPTHKELRVFPWACIDPQLLVITLNDEVVDVARGGAVDAFVQFPALAGSTPNICAALEGRCGSYHGCMALDVSDEEEVVATGRLMLEERHEPPFRAPSNGDNGIEGKKIDDTGAGKAKNGTRDGADASEGEKAPAKAEE